MRKSSDKSIFHSTSSGKLYIDEVEFFKSDSVKSMLKKLLNSSVYKNIKNASKQASI